MNQQTDTEALAQILEGDQHHHFHHQLQGTEFTSHRQHHHRSHKNHHDLDLSNVGDSTGGEDDLDLALDDMGTPDLDTPQRTSTFGRPPSIRKGAFVNLPAVLLSHLSFVMGTLEG